MRPCIDGQTIDLEDLLSTLNDRDPSEIINKIVDLGLAMGEKDAEMILERDSLLEKWRRSLTEIYKRYIMSMEETELQHVLTKLNGSQLYRDIAGEAALMAYHRVSDMFAHIDFDQCRQFVLVGCGHLPMTALHVNDRTDVPEIMCIDSSSRAIASVQRLGACLNRSRFRGLQYDGQSYDYASADVVYVANMVSPKSSVVARVADTAGKDTQIIVREPYSLGHLWAESAESTLDNGLKVVARGPGSRYLSRDVFLRRYQ